MIISISICRSFLAAVVEHISTQFDSAAVPDGDIYIERVDGELAGQVFPNFPIRKESAIYAKNCLTQDEKSDEDSCEKNFPAHSKLTPY